MRGVFGTVAAPDGRLGNEALSGGHEEFKSSDGCDENGFCW
jgi:hypothetical protein